MTGAHLVCTRCGSHAVSSSDWRCDCGGAFDLVGGADNRHLAASGGLWRHGARLRVPADVAPLTLGEGDTPLLRWPKSVAGERTFVLLESLAPSGSFKDRGTAILLAVAAGAGFRRVACDSSGNMGASVAAYAAAHGLTCSIYAPADTSPGKLAQIRAYGAEVVLVAGGRERVAARLHDELEDTFYASHAWNPYFLEGTATAAYEMVERLDGVAPDHVVVPVGHGTLYLGLQRGFATLLREGVIARLPRLHVAQAAAFSPVVAAKAGEIAAAPSGEIVASPEGAATTLAEGVRIAHPVRLEAIVAALRATGGSAVAVTEDELAAAWHEAARAGFYIEPTCAVALAGLTTLARRGAIRHGETVVVPLTGSGLKTPAAAEHLCAPAQAAPSPRPTQEPT